MAGYRRVTHPHRRSSAREGLSRLGSGPLGARPMTQPGFGTLDHHWSRGFSTSEPAFSLLPRHPPCSRSPRVPQDGPRKWGPGGGLDGMHMQHA